MKPLATLLLLAFSALSLAAAEKRVARTETTALAIAFVDVASANGSLTTADNDAWLEVRTLSHQPGSHERVTRLRRQVGIRIVGKGEVAAGTARISARLESWDGRATVRIDGRTLTAAPLLVDAHAAIGAVAVHQIEIEVPVSVPAGPLAASIAWEVTTD